MTPAEHERLERRPSRIQVTVDTLKEIEAVVIRDSNQSGGYDLRAQRQRVAAAVSIYCAVLVSESQK
jgi:hypothetical protein